MWETTKQTNLMADDVQEECPRVSPPTKLISDHNYVCNILDIYD